MNFRKRFVGLLEFRRSYTTLNKVNKKQSHKVTINKLFLENEHLISIKQHIPPQYITLRKVGLPEHLYLICPKIAKTVASYVKAAVGSNKHQVIAETNAGLGLIASELLETGVKPVRLYETCPYFRNELKDFGTVYPGQVELFIKDIFHLHRYAFMDKQDKANRVEMLLKNIPKKNWTDEPVMTIVGTMPTLSFLIYLVKSLCFQNAPMTFGRFQILAVMKPRHYAILKATPQDNLLAYQFWSVLFNLFLDYELLEKFPREFFLPWESVSSKSDRYPANLERDKMYLVKINFKKELPLSSEQLLLLMYFGRHFFGRGSKSIIPTIERWVPGCGLNILLPKLNHAEYFEDMNIFTQFRELSPPQILAVFKEMVNYPDFSSSSFIAMMETDLVKNDTTETDVAERTPKQINSEDIEERLDR